MDVHCIQAHTKWGYNPDNDVHHKDDNKLNNALDNLDYSMSRSEHLSKTNKGNKHALGAIKSERVRQILSKANIGNKYGAGKRSEKAKANMAFAQQKRRAREREQRQILSA